MNYNSVLSLQHLVFDNIQFERKGFKNNNDLQFNIQIQIGLNDKSVHKVTLILKANKPDEYDVLISLSGFFSVQSEANIDDKMLQDLINKNAVAIMMPYLRSELSLLTAQPEMDSVVLPPFNINKMLSKESTEQ